MLDDRTVTAKVPSNSKGSASEQQPDCAKFNPEHGYADDEEYTLETSARLFKTTGGKYVVGIEEYDKTNEEHGIRFAEVAATLKELVELIKGPRPNVDNDILGELFEDTEIADQFVEQID